MLGGTVGFEGLRRKGSVYKKKNMSPTARNSHISQKVQFLY